MKPLFEIPELLTINGEPFKGTLELLSSGNGCLAGCQEGCGSGCTSGTGKGVVSDEPI